jgi:DNA-binding transcriptional ArsR family regulator
MTLPCACGHGGIIYNHMVVHRRLTNPQVDRIFYALSDTTRRDILTRVIGGRDASISTLAERYAMSFAAVQKHVAVLEEAGLVTKHPRGRERLVRGNPERVAQARELLTTLEAMWRERFSRIDLLLDPSTSTQD